MANKISVLIDVATDKAVSGLKGFKSSVMDADGAVGKLKAGGAQAFDSLKAHAGQLAVAGGAAIVAFGVKAVGAFQDTALAAGHLADASGLSVDAASRWIAVGDDIGVSAETIQKSFGKMAKEIGTGGPLLDKYGITVRKGADGQADMNATMLHAVDVLRSIQDPTKKAELAQQLLGRGWQDMAELIEQGSATLTASMAEVSEAQVIDPKEVEKARKMRESMDNLQDAISDVAVVIGEDLVPMVTVMADGLAKAIGPLSDVNQWTKDLATSVLTLTGVMKDNNSEIENAPVLLGKMGESLDAATRAGDMHVEMQEGMKGAVEESTEATEVAAKGTVDYGKALQGLQNALDRRIAATNDLVGGDIAVRNAQREARDAVVDLTVATDEQKLSAEELAVKTDDAALALIGAAEKAAAYDEKIGNAAGETLTAAERQDLFKDKLGDVAATLEPGSPLRVMLEEYIALLEGIPPEINTNVRVTRSGDLLTPIGGKRASGGPVAAGTSYLVGEQGPELLTMGAGSGHVTPNHQLGAGGGLVVNVQPGGIVLSGTRLTPDEVVTALSDFVRRNGPGPIRKLTGT